MSVGGKALPEGGTLAREGDCPGTGRGRRAVRGMGRGDRLMHDRE
jgi:hypothetical protein